MNVDIQHLYNELLELAKVQKEALAQCGFEDAIKIQKMCQDIVDKIQNIGEKKKLNPDPPTGKNDHEGEESSHRMQMTIKKILSLNNDMQTIIQAELISTTEELGNIQKMKAFYRNAFPHPHSGLTLSISVR